MSKTKSSELPHYELLYLISNKYSEVEVKPIMEKVNSLIIGNQGKITQSSELGKKLLKIAPKAIILADRGFGKATWFYLMMESLDASYVVRIPLRKKKNKKKVKQGLSSFQYWMTGQKTKEKALITVFVAKDKEKKKYYLASNLEGKSGKWLLATYMNRWDLENIFKDSDRALLPTSSRQPQMRLFCMVASFLLFALWQVSRVFNKEKWSLRSFVKHIIASLYSFLQIGVSPIGEIIPFPP